MIDLLTTDMKSVVPDDSINFMLVRGSEKAFCAGGDIRSKTRFTSSSNQFDIQESQRLVKLVPHWLRRSFSLNYLTGTVHKPYIALISGITMGGGIGTSVHSPYRVATETTTFAMPETAIGFFPDVGRGYFLPRLKGELGMYLALTGHRLKGRDVLHGGIATHLVGKEKIPSLLSELTESCDDPVMKRDPHYVVKSILDKYHKELPTVPECPGQSWIYCCCPGGVPDCSLYRISHFYSHTHSLNIDDRSFSLTPHVELIDKCFSGGSVEDIQMSLLDDGSDWSINQFQTNWWTDFNSHYKLCRHSVHQVNSCRDIGIIISDSLSWSLHYRSISSKAYGQMSLIRRTFSTSSIKVRKLLYISLVCSKLVYGSQLWRPMFIKDIVILERIQRRATRFITNDYASVPSHATPNVYPRAA
uniref:3-hydroxyisobutyryl-CoA hydrolase, mitochondrial n=1 Tax=Amphimedon queenslandica TaxID=400682 RepID=A0A1X7VG13_AMPQE